MEHSNLYRVHGASAKKSWRKLRNGGKKHAFFASFTIFMHIFAYNVPLRIFGIIISGKWKRNGVHPLF